MFGAPKTNKKKSWNPFRFLFKKKPKTQPKTTYTTRAGQGDWPAKTAGVRARFASERGDIYTAAVNPYRPAHGSIFQPRGMEVKFAVQQLSTGQVIPAPRTLPSLYGRVQPNMRYGNYHLRPRGTLTGIESVFR